MTSRILPSGMSVADFVYYGAIFFFFVAQKAMNKSLERFIRRKISELPFPSKILVKRNFYIS
jgi:hypothetical protein